MVRMGRGPINVDHYVADTGDNPGTATEAPRFPDLGACLREPNGSDNGEPGAR